MSCDSEALLQSRSHFEEIYGDRLVKMVLFGSQARGEADADSDIDVLVVLKGEVNPGEEIKRTSCLRTHFARSLLHGV